jgi:hypothetical protein
MASKIKSIDVAAVKDLLLWLRKERIAVQHVTIGEVALVVTMDHRMTHADQDRKPSEPARQGIIEQYGGALFSPPPVEDADDVIEPTVEDDD